MVCSFQVSRVLELGCGHGMPGIMFQMGGAEVHFQVNMLFSAVNFFLSALCKSKIVLPAGLQCGSLKKVDGSKCGKKSL